MKKKHWILLTLVTFLSLTSTVSSGSLFGISFLQVNLCDRLFKVGHILVKNGGKLGGSIDLSIGHWVSLETIVPTPIDSTSLKDSTIVKP